MSKIACRLAILAVSACCAGRAVAGIVDSPLPVLSVGQTTLHLYSVPGVMSLTGVETFFACTSTDAVPIQVGVEMFGSGGGAPFNDAAATSLTVAPGATVIFGTISAVGISVNSSVGPVGSKGSARILATSKNLICTVFAADPFNAPPTSMTYLTIVRKTKQKAAN